jgi:GTP-binding protein
MLAVLQAVNAIERSDGIVLMIDATQGASEQDARIAGLAIDRGRAIVVALNKMDALSREERDKAIRHARETFSFMPWAPLVMISAKSGRGVAGLVDEARKVATHHKQRVTTGQLNRFFEETIERQPPPTSGGRSVRIYFVTQAAIAPPTFIVSTNFPEKVHFSYQRFIANQLRERFGFEGTPLRIHYRPKTRDKDA